jgi:hypothetical protein
MLKWVKNKIKKDIGIEVSDFGGSWSDGFELIEIIDEIK